MHHGRTVKVELEVRWRHNIPDEEQIEIGDVWRWKMIFGLKINKFKTFCCGVGRVQPRKIVLGEYKLTVKYFKYLGSTVTVQKNDSEKEICTRLMTRAELLFHKCGREMKLWPD